MKFNNNHYKKISKITSLKISYLEFRQNKRRSLDIVEFEKELQNNLINLYRELLTKSYVPGPYAEFYITDPKLRLIHKSPVRDRVVHHLVSSQLQRVFEPIFIRQSYACRHGKGTHKGLYDLQSFCRQVSKNNTGNCFALKCDIKKYFASIDHKILIRLLDRHISDPDFINLMKKIIFSFNSGIPGRGLPIGNLTSQICANIYLHELDRFIKYKLKIKYYLRYCDDFIILSQDRHFLLSLISTIEEFLNTALKLSLHPKKVRILPYKTGIDFVGYVVFPGFVVPRSKTKRRMIRKIRKKIAEYRSGQIDRKQFDNTIKSYLGYLKHCNAFRLAREIKEIAKNVRLTAD